MDELVHHCIRELAFEGDLGCDVSRLRDFIKDFHARGTGAQNVDDAYCAFVWSAVVQQPEVCVGIAPDGAPEVYVAPQQSKQQKKLKKAKKKGEIVSDDEPAPAVSLDLVDDAALRSLEDLKAQYGDALRIAVDPERSFVAITGSHIRPSKLTPMVYTSLQLVSRGREKGISVVELSKKTGYDPKTCHYLVDKLLELNLIEKRKKSGVGANFCIHKYFFERSEIWKTVQAEEQQAAQALTKTEDVDLDEEDEPMTPAPHLGMIQFEPIDTRHLSSLPLIRARLEKLLKNSPSHMHRSQNLLVTIGFPNPTKSDRRFFQTRLKELMVQGIVEKVQVRPPRAEGKLVTCIRLLSPDQVELSDEAAENPENEELPTLKANITFHRQIVDLIDQSGIEGITLSELSKALCNFDKRIIEHQLVRLQVDPPSHIADLCIVQLGESHGRERRYKYFTSGYFRAVAAREKLEKQPPDEYYAHVGEFAAVDPQVFYADDAAFARYVDSFAVYEGTGKGKGKGKKARTNPLLADGSVKKGRPTKPDAELKRKRKRKREEGPEGEPVAKRPRGRPRKTLPPADVLPLAAGHGDSAAADPSQAASTSALPEKTPKKRGRPPKVRPAEDADAGASASAADSSASAPVENVPKKRGRPPKVRTEEPLTPVIPSVPKKRGRPPKKKPDAAEPALADPALGGDAVEGASQDLDQIMGDPVGEDDINEGASGAPEARTEGLPDRPPQTDGTLATPSSAAPEQPTPTAGLTDGSTPVSPTTARIRRSTRVRKTRVRDDEPQSVTGTPTPARRRRGRPSVAEEASVDMEPDFQPPPTTDQSIEKETPAAIAEPTSDSQDVVMTDSSAPVATGTTTAEANNPASSNGLPIAISSSDSVIEAIPAGSISQMQPPAVPEHVPGDVDVAPTSDINQQKRSEPDTPSVQPLTKRARLSGTPTGYRATLNISQQRRDKEIIRILQDAGGLLNIGTKDVFEAHAALVDTLHKAGEPTSTLPGSRIDKRTLESTLRDLEAQGKIKLVTTAVQSATGVSRQVKIAYLVDTPPEALKEFLISLNNTPVAAAQPVLKTLDAPVAYGGSKTQRIARPAASAILLNTESGSQDAKTAAKLLQSDEKTIQASLLTEADTIVQLYGYINGKIARARALHLHSVALFTGQNASPNIVSVEQRIINLSYYMLDLPVSVCCSVISCRTQNDELVKLLKTPERRQTAVGRLPSIIADDLEVSKSRWRICLMSLVNILYSFGLIVPLAVAQGPNSFVTCAPNGEHPTAFDKITYDGSATLKSPQYWQFTSNAPVHLWALYNHEPPFWRSISVQDAPSAIQYWENLMRASIDVEFARAALSSVDKTAAQPAHLNVSPNLVKLLRRPAQWRISYRFSWFQKQYLRQQVDASTAATPLQSDDGQTRVEKIAEVASIPKDEVVRFYERERLKMLHAIEKKQAKHESTDEKARRKAEEKAALAQRAAEAQAQRERDWEALLTRVHPEPITDALAPRIRQVKSRYMQAITIDVSKWESEIMTAVEESKNVPVQRLVRHNRPPLPTFPAPQPWRVPLPPAIVSRDRSIEELIELQGPPLPPAPKEKKKTGKRKRKDKDKDNDTENEQEKELETEANDGKGKTKRKSRFQWTKDLDELARDASAIIQARCRGKRNPDWAALEQVFPTRERNAVRQHIGNLRKEAGGESYFKRLENRWYELWRAHCGTPELPDEDPTSPSNFDIIAHLKFLRKYVDKNALRVGFSEEDTPVVLPLTAAELYKAWDVIETLPTVPTWETMWNGTAEEGREKHFLQQAFLTGGNEIPTTKKHSHSSDMIYVADAALKMTLSTPNEVYDSENASRLLTSVGEDSVTTAMRDMLENGVLSRIVRDPKRTKPGRMLKISESNQNALGGSINEDLFQDAAALESLLSQREDDGWYEWPLISSDGDIAALIELVSDNKIELTVDTTHAQAARSRLEWNSKKTDDDDIETSIEIRLKDVSSLNAEPTTTADPTATVEQLATAGPAAIGPTDSTPSTEALHDNVNVQGEKACCRMSSSGPADCVACLDAQFDALAAGTQDQQSSFYRRLANVLREAGSNGMTKRQLLDIFDPSEHELLTTAVDEMLRAEIPLAYWLGYREIVFVSAYHITPWTVLIAEGDMDCTRIFPRRWLDIDGRTLSEVWEAAQRAAISIILFHSGIAQAELRWRLRAVYDRQEVEDVLAYLLDQGYVQRHTEGRPVFYPSLASNEEETSIFWTIGKCWYTVSSRAD